MLDIRDVTGAAVLVLTLSVVSLFMVGPDADAPVPAGTEADAPEDPGPPSGTSPDPVEGAPIEDAPEDAPAADGDDADPSPPADDDASSEGDEPSEDDELSPTERQIQRMMEADQQGMVDTYNDRARPDED